MLVGAGKVFGLVAHSLDIVGSETRIHDQCSRGAEDVVAQDDAAGGSCRHARVAIDAYGGSVIVARVAMSRFTFGIMPELVPILFLIVAFHFSLWCFGIAEPALWTRTCCERMMRIWQLGKLKLYRSSTNWRVMLRRLPKQRVL